jgi:hypothetical protein
LTPRGINLLTDTFWNKQRFQGLNHWIKLVEKDDIHKQLFTHEKFQVKTVKLHPQYDPVSYANDVAVLELAEPLDGDTVAGAVCLPLLPLEQYRQRRLKYTEHKPFGRHYLGVTRSSHPHTSERTF